MVYAVQTEDAVLYLSAAICEPVKPENCKWFNVQLASLFSMMNHRLAGLEDQVAHQQQLIMDLTYQVDAKQTGSLLPFISGKFGYGLGTSLACCAYLSHSS